MIAKYILGHMRGVLKVQITRLANLFLLGDHLIKKIKMQKPLNCLLKEIKCKETTSIVILKMTTN